MINPHDRKMFIVHPSLNLWTAEDFYEHWTAL